VDVSRDPWLDGVVGNANASTDGPASQRRHVATANTAEGDRSMKSSDITIGGTYTAKVSDRLVPVRIDRVSPHGGWDATNLVTNKTVRIKSAQRLRSPAPDRDARKRAKAVAETRAADAAANAHAVPGETPAKRGRTAKTAAQPKSAKPSGLDAAHQVLTDAGQPMRCKDIVDTMLAKGLWTTGGKTPAATIYAAILREIQTKGADARFRKTDRGLFTTSGK
jgi:hypothetical protein